MSEIFHRIIDAGNQKNPLISILLSKRNGKLPKKDELLLHSAGPVSDLSEYSFLPSIDSFRILFIEPPNISQSTKTSVLEGEISFNSPNPLHVLVQEMKNNIWSTTSEHYSSNLQEAMNIVKKYEIKCEIDRELPIIPGGFAGLLGYDINRWVIPLNL